MPTIHVTGRDGEEKAVSVDSGMSVMEAIRDNGFDELLALCGGCCSCATCHVHVDPAWIDRVGRLADDSMEADLLQFAEGTTTESRLACQIKLDDRLDGLVLRVPEQQY